MSDPTSSSSPAHPLLEPATIEELRKRVAERRMAREASAAKVPKPPKAKAKRRSPAVARVARPPAPIVADQPVDPDFISPSVAAVMSIDPEKPALNPVERAQLFAAMVAADQEDSDLARATAASASMVPVDADRRRLINTIVGWLVADFDPTDEFQTSIRARYIPRLYESVSCESYAFQGELERAFARTQKIDYVPPTQARIARLDSLLRSCQGDVCPIVQMMTKDSLCAFQFNESLKFEVPPKWDGNY